MRSKRPLLAMLLLAAWPVVLSAAEPSAACLFVPVQAGFTTAADPVLPNAPDRVMIRLVPKAAAVVQTAVGDKRGDGTTVTGLAALDAALQEVGARRVVRPYDLTARKSAKADYGLDRVFRCDLDGTVDVPAAVTRLRAVADVEVAVPDWRAFPAATPGDPYYPDHWGHENTGQLPDFDWGGTWDHTGPPVGTPGFDADADVAWGGSQGYGDPGTVIAILDSGVGSVGAAGAVDVLGPTILPTTDIQGGAGYRSGDYEPFFNGTSCATPYVAGVCALIRSRNPGWTPAPSSRRPPISPPPRPAAVPPWRWRSATRPRAG